MGWKGGYGTYKMRPSWDVYGSGLMTLESNKPLSRSTSSPKWQSPRRRVQGGVYTPPVLDMKLQRNGTYALQQSRRAMALGAIKKLGPTSFILPLARWAINTLEQQLEEPFPIVTPQTTAFNANWVRVCTGADPVSDCRGMSNLGYLSGNGTFCGRATQPPAWYPGLARMYMYQVLPRCDTGSTWWKQRFRRIPPAPSWAAVDSPFYHVPFMPGVQPFPWLPLELFPGGGHSTDPEPRPNHVPFRLRHALRRAMERLTPEAGSGYAPGPPATPPPTIWPPPPGRHELRPPRRGEKERKATGNRLLWGAFWAALWATEAKDVLVALAEGLGYNKVIKVCKGGFCYYKRAYPKQPLAKFIYNRWLEATPAELKQAIANVIANEIEDRLIARFLGGRHQLEDGTVFRQFGNSWINARF